ncbi:hypothetical protein EN814_23990 [Mesorhizobium sp. M2D.F.Ca.ET.171.01.1.1]|uniref:hypothetical protein n=1 Tax=unclassified Mesorhizobium TaxID=325217 RepID=UPI001091F09C|nr:MULTISPECIES: hypothetical protein [unclassified Mesorhizobium]TGS92706.1 hypothetical protein EN821_24005 [Mesorhizobium sp. M2D.F.Ca.ET.178.01.1.1]TGT08511.1 hypothetical protein EN814_23990 [Mesorhizobium sp. M2D.F.Ca.ET.171.01.1.1]
MAKTSAEYQRAYRQRKAELAKRAGDPTDKVATQPFSEFLANDGNWPVIEEVLDRVGVTPPVFDSDTDDQWQEQWEEPYRASIGRAERMVGAFLDAASGLASAIARYKRHEIDRAIADLEASGLNDAASRKAALSQIMRLNRVREQLDRQVRWTLPQWKTTGDSK